MIFSCAVFDTANGEKLWQRDWESGPLVEVHATNSQVSSTPAADAERVYFYLSTLGLLFVANACLFVRTRTQILYFAINGQSK